MRRAFYLAYDDTYCEYLKPEEVDERLEPASRWCPPPTSRPTRPAIPVLVPGQVFSRQILSFMRGLDTPEIHGYRPDLGYRVYVDKALEIAAPVRPATQQAAPQPEDHASEDHASGDNGKDKPKVSRRAAQPKPSA